MKSEDIKRKMLHYLAVLLYTASFVARSSAKVPTPISFEHKILQHVLSLYDKDAHPGGGTRVNVIFGAKLARLVKVEEVNNIIKAQWWMKQSWYNPDIQWNKSEYGNISIIYVDPERIWVPDIILYNNGDEKVDAAGGREKFHTKISMTDKGIHTWYAPTIFTSMCKIDVRFFPFDNQLCELQFGSWAYDSSKIDLEIDYNETGRNSNIYQENNEWRVQKITAEKRMKNYSCCGVPFADILISLYLSRRSYHYMINLVFPCAVIACMVFFTFILPAESGERISLCITVLMAMTIFQELTSEKLPVSPDGFILIEMYYTSAISSIGLAIAATCVVLNFYYKKTKMPNWLRSIILGKLASCIGIDTKRNHKKRKLQKDQVIANPIASTIDTESETQFGVTLKSINHRRRLSHEAAEDESDVQVETGVHTNGVSNGDVKRHCSTIRSERAPMPDAQAPNPETVEEDWEQEWRSASRVLDRIILISGMILATITSLTIFLQAPRVRDMLTGKGDL